MNQHRVCVYAICKNEAPFVERWMKSMAEADDIVVLDTGSTDGTPDLLRALGARVTVEEIVPWRFDTARNRSLALVPEEAEICVCTDLDEEFEPGWRARVEAAWSGVQRLSYRYTWSFGADGSEGVVFWTDKIHANHLFRWTHPVHEVLTFTGEGSCATGRADGVQLNHRPDPSKSRAQYLPLLELAVREDPDDDRNMHYLGREYLFRGQCEDCISTLLRHLAMGSATWEDERAASMRYIARAYEAKGRADEARRWLYRAIGEAPHLREPYMDLAALCYRQQDWEGVLMMTAQALKIERRPMSYISEPAAWGGAPYDLQSIVCYWLGLYERALENADRALAENPGDERIAANRRLILERMTQPARGAERPT